MVLDLSKVAETVLAVSSVVPWFICGTGTGTGTLLVAELCCVWVL